MKSKPYFLLLPLLACLFAACSDDGYHYPSVKLEYLTAYSDADGASKYLLTDEGKKYAVLENADRLQMKADTFTRIVSNYELVKAADGTTGVRLYAVLHTISPLPLPAGEFKDGVKTDPVELQSIWMGRDYLNVLLGIKAQDGRHLLHFIEDKVEKDDTTGQVNVELTLYHDASNDVLAYTKRAYVSVPLWNYAAEGVRKVTVALSVNTYANGIKKYHFDYIPRNH